MHQNNTTPGRLFVVATPIGNLQDCSQRMVQTLTMVDFIACEDTRHTLNLCRHLSIKTPLISYFREKEQEKSEKILALLAQGKNVALVSDAGTPGICDPGAVLVRKVRDAGLPIVAVAGPSALATALSIAGLSQSAFYFCGFLPANPTERRQCIQKISTLTVPLIFFETPHRIHSSIEMLASLLGDRFVQLFRELTKIHEECCIGTLKSLQSSIPAQVKGELVLIVEGAPPPSQEKPESLDDLLLWYRDVLKATLKTTVQNVAADLDLPKSQVYKAALSIWQQEH